MLAKTYASIKTKLISFACFCNGGDLVKIKDCYFHFLDQRTLAAFWVRGFQCLLYMLSCEWFLKGQDVRWIC
jgi:hypothetical protein